MNQGGLLLATALGTIFVLFGLWLWPKWRRMRKRRELTFSLARARERFLSVSVIGSIAFGAVILAIVQINVRSFIREQQREKEMLRFAFRCDRHSLEVHNRGDEKRRVQISEVEVYRTWGWEQPDHWRLATDVARTLAAGETLQIPLGLHECAPRSPLDDPPRCELRFQFSDEITDDWAGCVLQLAEK
jgi:hypothetical protein